MARGGGVYLTVRDDDKANLVPIARQLRDLGFLSMQRLEQQTSLERTMSL